jgi:tRNA(Ile)-lysidine synthase
LAALADSPLTFDEFSAYMTAALPFGVGGGETIAVAVSGGGDSMALAALLKEWGAAHSVPLYALTVDHGLRSESLAEAAQVGSILSGWGVPHVTLCWEGEKPRSRIQELARAARYRLMGEFCRSKNIRYLFLAHHADDQMETFLYRLAKGSGIDGLTGMSPCQVFEEEGITLVRPLLGVSHRRLIATCLERQIKWIEDQSNVSQRFVRGRLRGAKEVLEEEGLTVPRILSAMRRFDRIVKFAEQVAETEYKNNLIEKEAKRIVMSLDRLKVLPEEVVLRIFKRLILEIGGKKTYPPRLQDIEALVHRFLSSSEFKGATIGGCIFRPNQSRNHLTILKED